MRESIRILLVSLFALRSCLVFSEAEPIEVMVSVDFNEDSQGRLIIKGKTNMPDQAKLLLSLIDYEKNKQYQDKSYVTKGVFSGGPFGTDQGLPAGNYQLDITFTVTPLQPESVQKVLGENGKNLSGEFVVSADPFEGKIIEAKFSYVKSASFIDTESCYQLGVRYGRCVYSVVKDGVCNEADDFVIPERCRNLEETQRGIESGVYEVEYQ